MGAGEAGRGSALLHRSAEGRRAGRRRTIPGTKANPAPLEAPGLAETDTKERVVSHRVMDLRQLLSLALGEAAVPAELGTLHVSDVCDDSRQVTPGCVFVAVPGAAADGRTFIADAVARGCAAIVADREAAVPPGPVAIRVADVRWAVARLAAVFHGLTAAQGRGELQVIGVTGTNGKSTTVYMIRSLLASAGRTAAMLGTIEYDLVGRKIKASLTTPGPVVLASHLSEAHAAGARFAVMEVSSHSLDQRRTDGISFSTAVFTNLTQDHLDYHQTLERYLLAKRRLFDGLTVSATAVVNGDDPSGDRIIEHCPARILRYGLEGRNQVRATRLESDLTGTRFLLTHPCGACEVRTHLVGRHNVYNALAAAAAGLAAGLDESAIQAGLASLANVPGRLQRVDTADLGFNVFVDYAHTDDALRNVLGTVRPLTPGRVWCVFGCGGDRDRTKRPLMARAVAQAADRFIITSDNPRTEDPLAIIAQIEQGLSAADRAKAATVPDRAAAIRQAVAELREGDTLVIAGKGHEDYQILGQRRIHFDDAEVAAEAIRGRRQVQPCGH